MSIQESRRLHSPQIDRRQVFGVIPREPQPSMFDILTWNTDRIQNILPYRALHPEYHYPQEQIPPENHEVVKQNRDKQQKPAQNQITTVPKPCEGLQQSKKAKIERPITANLYQYEEVVPVVKKKKAADKEPADLKKSRPYSAHPTKNKGKANHNQKPVKKAPFAASRQGNTNQKSSLMVVSKQYPASIGNISNQSHLVHYSLPEQSKTRTIISAKNIESSVHHQKKKKNKGELPEEQAELLKKKDEKEAPLKFMNRRGDFIQAQREEEVKKNRLALKPTECYPGQYSVKTIDLAQCHSADALPAGKRNPVHEDIRELMVYPPYSRC